MSTVFTLNLIAARLTGGELSIKFVDGEQVREDLVEYTMGGHHEVYPEIPEGEIWIDDRLSTVDQVMTTIHEIAELLMMEQFSLNYDTAHELASTAEEAIRSSNLFRDAVQSD